MKGQSYHFHKLLHLNEYPIEIMVLDLNEYPVLWILIFSRTIIFRRFLYVLELIFFSISADVQAYKNA